MTDLNLNELMKMFHAEVDCSGEKAPEILSNVFSALAFDNRIRRVVNKNFGKDESLKEDAISEFKTMIWSLRFSKEKRWNPEKSAFTSWAFMHLNSICVNMIRKNKTSWGKDKKYKTKFLEESDEIQKSYMKDALQIYINQEEIGVWRHMLDQSLHLLPEEQVKVIGLVREGKQGREIAELMGIHPSDVTKLKNKAIARIKVSRDCQPDRGGPVF